jgi:hypothetical protein
MAAAHVAAARTLHRRGGLDATTTTTAREMVDRILCPPDEERERNVAGTEAFDGGIGGGDRGVQSSTAAAAAVAISNDDPRGEYTYGEFPFGSFDALIDRAAIHVAAATTGMGGRRGYDGDDDDDMRGRRRRRRRREHCTMVDLGSGCGRLVFYAALTRGEGWDVHGIEIGTSLHSLAVRSLRRGVDRGWFEHAEATTTATGDAADDDERDRATGGDDDDDASSRSGGGGTIAFHNGNALSAEDPYFPHTRRSSSSYYTTTTTTTTGGDESSSSPSTSSFDSIRSLLSRTDLLFAYSTVWETSKVRPFDPELGAMVLSSKWSSTLASTCKEGCVAVTTDRALDPNDGWKLLDRMEVENPCVWGSVGYISILEKK